MSVPTKRVSSRLQVRVTTRSSREGLGSAREGTVVVRVHASPVDNAANQAVVKVLGKALDVPAGDITIIAGHHSRDKTLEIRDLSEAELTQRLQRAGAR